MFIPSRWEAFDVISVATSDRIALARFGGDWFFGFVIETLQYIFPMPVNHSGLRNQSFEMFSNLLDDHVWIFSKFSN